MEHLALKTLSGFKKLQITLVGISLLLGGCYVQNSTTRAAISDNKSFEKRGYIKQSPLRPMENLSYLPNVEDISFQYYEEYSISRLQYNKVNEKYFSWLSSETKKRRSRKEKNGFSQEATPLVNEYYLKRNYQSASKLNDNNYLIILNNLQIAKEKFKSREISAKEDIIEDYEIKGGPYRYIKKKKVVYDE